MRATALQFHHTGWSCHPKFAVPILEVIKSHAAIERIVHDGVDEITVVQAAGSAASGNQQVAFAVFANRENLVAREAVLLGIYPGRFAVHQFHQTTVVKADPNSSAMVLVNGGGLVAGQAFRFAVHAEQVVPQAVETAVHAHPEVALGVLINAAHPIALVVRTCQRAADEAPIFQTRQTTVGSGPEVSVAIFPHGPNVVIRQPLLNGVMLELALRATRQEPEAAAYPEIAMPVLEERNHDIAHRTEHGNESIAFQADHTPKTGCIDTSVASAIKGAQGLDGQTLARTIIRKLSVLEAVEVDAGNYPDGAGWIFCDGVDGRVVQAVLLGEGGELSVVIARETAQRPDPQTSVFGRPQRSYAIAGQRAILFVEDYKIIAVKLREPLVGAEPKISVLGLRDGSYSVLGKTVFLGPDGPGVLCERAAGVQG